MPMLQPPPAGIIPAASPPLAPPVYAAPAPEGFDAGDVRCWLSRGRSIEQATELARIWRDFPDLPPTAPLEDRMARGRERIRAMKPLNDAIAARTEAERQARNFAFMEARVADGTICAEMGLHVAGEADCGEAALEALCERSVDILFLDIAMPGIGGMEAARRVPRDPQAPAIVFTTAFTAHALAAFDVGAVDYLLKPIEPDRLALALALTRVRAFLAGRDAGTTAVEDHLWVSHRGDLVRVDLAAVQRVDAERDYVRLHVDGRSHLLRETMENIAARLPAPLFRRIHRSTIIRRNLVAGLRHEGGGVWSVVLPDGATLRIGRSYLEDVRGG